jgi:hypothetical protein
VAATTPAAAPLRPVADVIDVEAIEPATARPPVITAPSAARPPQVRGEPVRANGSVTPPPAAPVRTLAPDDFIAAPTDGIDPVPAKVQLERYGLVGAKP